MLTIHNRITHITHTIHMKVHDKLQLQHSETSSSCRRPRPRCPAWRETSWWSSTAATAGTRHHQAKRLGEQLAKYQQENTARLVTRERVWCSTSPASRPSSRGWLLRFSRTENAFERGGRGVLIQTLAPDMFCHWSRNTFYLSLLCFEMNIVLLSLMKLNIVLWIYCSLFQHRTLNIITKVMSIKCQSLVK